MYLYYLYNIYKLIMFRNMLNQTLFLSSCLLLLLLYYIIYFFLKANSKMKKKMHKISNKCR